MLYYVHYACLYYAKHHYYACIWHTSGAPLFYISSIFSRLVFHDTHMAISGNWLGFKTLNVKSLVMKKLIF